MSCGPEVRYANVTPCTLTSPPVIAGKTSKLARQQGTYRWSPRGMFFGRIAGSGRRNCAQGLEDVYRRPFCKPASGKNDAEALPHGNFVGGYRRPGLCNCLMARRVCEQGMGPAAAAAASGTAPARSSNSAAGTQQGDAGLRQPFDEIFR